MDRDKLINILYGILEFIDETESEDKETMKRALIESIKIISEEISIKSDRSCYKYKH